MRQHIHRHRFYPHTFSLGIAALLGGLLLWLHWAILAKFNWITTDMDQVFMWYGVQEMREGRFHMPRYFGQDYGSMLEAWLAVPFTFINYNKLLPLSAYSLAMLPYGLMVFTGSPDQRSRLLVLSIAFVGLMSTEYVMIASMPRDMGSGVAVTAIALPFIRGERWFHRLFIGFFCLLGWSFNANAALFGAVITLFVLFSDTGRNIRTWFWVFAGYALAFGVHWAVEWFYVIHPDLIVHHRWPLNWQWSLFKKGLASLSSHWGQLVPYFHDHGGLYLLLLVIIALLAWINGRIGLLIASVACMILVVVTLGLDKVHDGIDSVYFSHERMYMALPPALLFLVFQLGPGRRFIAVVALLSIASIVHQRMGIEEKVAEVRDPSRPTMLVVMDLEQMTWRCKDLETYWRDTEAQAFIFGPGSTLGDWVLARGCACITDMELTVKPEYERKTWELRKLDRPDYSRFLWMSPEVDDSLLNSLNVDFHRVDSVEGYGAIYSVQGENINPMELYRRAGFETVNY